MSCSCHSFSKPVLYYIQYCRIFVLISWTLLCIIWALVSELDNNTLYLHVGVLNRNHAAGTQALTAGYWCIASCYSVL